MPTAGVTPCSAKHEKHCSRWHADLVLGYRLERYRQEVAHEGLTGGHTGDAAHVKAQGHALVTFSDWLKANRRERRPDDVLVGSGFTDSDT